MSRALPGSTGAKARIAERRARAAEALRDNLHRRKAQERSRRRACETDTEGVAPTARDDEDRPTGRK